MMRRLLALVVILCMATVANAGLVISVHETDGSEYDGHVLEFSDYLTLNIETDGDGLDGDYYFILTADPTLATITGLATAYVPAGSSMESSQVWGDSAVTDGYFPGPDDGPYGTIASTNNPPYDPYDIALDGFVFHCEGVDDATISMYLLDSGGSPVNGGLPVDQVVIPQVPEPVTIALLGLGGLFLRRRK